MHASRTDELMNCFSMAESCLSREFRTGQLMDEVHGGGDKPVGHRVD